MTDSDSDSDQQPSQEPNVVPGDAFDYDATASASLSDSPLGPEPGVVYGPPGTGPGWDTYSAMGNGPGWSSQPTYPAPSQHENAQHEYAQQGYQRPMYGAADPAAPYGRDGAGEPFSEKSKLTAGLLQILIGFLGICGVGRLYIGSTTIGLTQMLLVFVGYALMIVLIGFLIVPVVWLWALVDGILMLTGVVRDAQGRPLRG